ncbi:hypothetical protein LCGC14_1214180 [marine sediment metagenome]|uniref:Uncharacterized protein n=1 Tax=marine sediment metagenome TaxID=412755 RepID=A0A0F9M0L8_9ZZZZ
MRKLKILLVLLLLLYPTLQSADSVAYGNGVRLAKTGVQYILNFELFEVDGVDLRIDASDAGSDVTIRKDQGADTTAVNDFVDEGLSYSLTITANEMQAKQIVVYVIDSATKQWLDTSILIETYGSPTAEHAFDLNTATQDVNVASIDSGAITATSIAADAITSAKIADNAIAAEHIAADAIGSSEIATAAIDADAIATDAIGAAEIAADAIGASEIATDAIGAAEIAADAIGTAEIANDAITATEIAANAIGASELATDAIGSAELAATAATEIVDDWETQSQADPTGFHVNVLEIGGTAQTANDNGADINTILTGTVTDAQGTNVATDVAAMIDANNRIDVGTWLGTAVTLGNSAPDVNVASEDNIDFGATKKASLETAVDDAFDNVITASPTTGSRDDVLDRQEESIVNGSAATGTLSTTEMTTDLTITVNDQMNGRILTFRKDTTTAALRGQQTDIVDTVTTNGKLTFTALTTAPVNGDKFEIN